MPQALLGAGAGSGSSSTAGGSADASVSVGVAVASASVVTLGAGLDYSDEHAARVPVRARTTAVAATRVRRRCVGFTVRVLSVR